MIIIWRLICFYTVCLWRFYGFQGKNGLIIVEKFIVWENFNFVRTSFKLSQCYQPLSLHGHIFIIVHILSDIWPSKNIFCCASYPTCLKLSAIAPSQIIIIIISKTYYYNYTFCNFQGYRCLYRLVNLLLILLCVLKCAETISVRLQIKNTLLRLLLRGLHSLQMHLSHRLKINSDCLPTLWKRSD